MLKVKSFKFSDAEGMNALLSEHRMASEAHILVSNGEICIPYEDGTAPTKGNIIAQLAELRNNHVMELELAKQSLSYNSQMLKKFVNKKEKFEQFSNMAELNKHEIERLENNIALLEERMKELAQ